MSWLQNLIGHKLLQTKDLHKKHSLRKLLNEYSNIQLETYLQVKESLRNIPKKLYIPALTHILNCTKSSLPLMTRQEQRDKDLSCLYIAYHYNEINSKLTHLSSYTNPEVKKKVHSKINNDLIEDILNKFAEGHDLAELSHSIFTQCPEYTHLYFIIYDDHPFIFPIRKHHTIANYRWFE